MINRNFKLIWFGKLISQLGDKFYAIALAWWILQNTGSSVIMGFFLVATVLPAIILGLFTGALTDLWNRKTMLVVTDIVRGLLVLAVSLLSLFDSLAVWHVFVIGSCLSAVTAFFDPVIQAVIPDVVEEKDLQKANGLSQLVGGVCQVAGPMFGALAVSLFGMTIVFFANSISYFIAAVLSALLVWKSTGLSALSGSTLLQEVKDGLQFVRGQKNIMIVLTVIGAAHFFVGNLFVIMPFLANGLNGNGVNNLGYLEMLIGAGLIVGSIMNGRKKTRKTDETILIKLIIGFGAGLLMISLAQWKDIRYIIVYLPMFFILGLIIANASIFWQLLLQLGTPANMKGRVFSISSLIGNVSLPIAYGAVGILMKTHTIKMIMLASGACLILLGVSLSMLQKRDVAVSR